VQLARIETALRVLLQLADHYLCCSFAFAQKLWSAAFIEMRRPLSSVTEPGIPLFGCWQRPDKANLRRHEMSDGALGEARQTTCLSVAFEGPFDGPYALSVPAERRVAVPFIKPACKFRGKSPPDSEMMSPPRSEN